MNHSESATNWPWSLNPLRYASDWPWKLDVGSTGWIIHSRHGRDVVAFAQHDQAVSFREACDARVLSVAPESLALLREARNQLEPESEKSQDLARRIDAVIARVSR